MVALRLSWGVNWLASYRSRELSPLPGRTVSKVSTNDSQREMHMTPRKALPLATAVPLLMMLTTPGHAQVRTEVPPVEAGTKPITVERIKIHGVALEGNGKLSGGFKGQAALVSPRLRRCSPLRT